MEQDSKTRERLAFWVVISGLIATALMACTAIAFAGKYPKTAITAKEMLTITLPVIGTWVGTVLAFYFARENFESAAKQTRLILGQQLDKPAKDSAIAVGDIKAITLPAADGPEKLTLEAIRTKLKDIKKFRVPVLDEAKRARFVIHQQPLDSFLMDHKAVTEPTGGWKLKDLCDDSTYGPEVRDSFAVIKEDATMAEAKVAMEGRPHCQDVFLTPNGNKSEAITGWLTNNEIQRAASA